ncbi:uncharacterized protein LOC100678230 [Nasonia vitripennis]|uniref:Transmembrane protein 223 n=1 Tax=Nasonia vitripennis TaxID=7425 RepID=A0A7M7Q5V4_NASVI|nr:uncharacterized protein LOC100678230 [Nasonia vitripennis]
MFGAVIAVSRLHIRAAPHFGGLAVAKTFKQCLSQEVSQYKLQQSTLGVRQFVTWRTLVSKKSTKKDDLGWGHYFKRATSLFRPKLVIPGKEPKPIETNPLKVNTKVQNNVMLYRFEKPYLYKGALIFGGVALVGCLAMADNVFLILCKNLWNPDKPLLTRLYEHALPLAFIAVGCIAGPAIFYTVWYITKRTVKYIVLHKGGKTVTIITYHPFKGEVTTTLPVNNLSTSSGRTAAKSYIPLRVRDTKLKYMVDKNGNFVNKELFDVTVGINRF